MALSGKELFVGGEPDSVRLVSGDWGVGTNSGYIDTAYSACALNLATGTYESLLYDSDMGPISQTTGSDFWFHAMIVPYATTANGNLAIFYTSEDVPIFRVNVSSGYNMNFQINTGGIVPSWTTLLTRNVGFAKNVYDIKYNSGDKTLSLFLNQEIAYTGSHPSVALGNVSKFRMGKMDGASPDTYISQILVTEDRPTIGALVRTRKATGQGALAEMSGPYTNLVKTSVNDLTSVISSVAGQKSSYLMQPNTTPENMEIGGVWLWTRARRTASGPQNMKALLRAGGMNYVGLSMELGDGFSAVGWRWDNNPSTTAPWTSTSYNSIELGMESAA